MSDLRTEGSSDEALAAVQGFQCVIERFYDMLNQQSSYGRDPDLARISDLRALLQGVQAMSRRVLSITARSPSLSRAFAEVSEEIEAAADQAESRFLDFVGSSSKNGKKRRAVRRRR